MNKKELAKLQKKWDDKLKDSGFRDLESRKSDMFFNKAVQGGATKKIQSGEAGEVSEAYSQLTTFYINYNFQRIWDKTSLKSCKAVEINNFKVIDIRKIFMLYLAGESVVQICRIMKMNNSDRRYVYEILNIIFKFAYKNSKAIKSEAKMFIDNFSTQKARGRTGKVQKNTCNKCKKLYYYLEDGATDKYCKDCCEIKKYRKSGGKSCLKITTKD